MIHPQSTTSNNIEINKPFHNKHGQWLYFDGVYCSECHYKLQTTGIPTYCPNCYSKNINIYSKQE